jgi:hypothetical protein
MFQEPKWRSPTYLRTLMVCAMLTLAVTVLALSMAGCAL